MREEVGARDAELQRAVERAPQAMWCVDADGRIPWANAAARSLLGVERAEGQRLRAVLDRDEHADRLEALRDGQGDDEVTLPWTEGRHFRVTAYPVHEDEEEPRHVFAAVDVTAQHEAEAARDEVQERLHTLVDQSLVGIYVIRDGRILYVNEMIERLTGYDREELTAPTFRMLDIIVEEDHEQVIENIRQRIDGNREDAHYTIRVRHEDGHLVEVEVHGARIEYGGQPAILGAMIDVTERRRVEANLRALLDNSPSAFILLDRELRVQAYNEVAQQMAALFESGELHLGDRMTDHVLPDNRDAFLASVHRALEGGTVQLERCVPTSESVHWLEVTYAPVWKDGHIGGVCFSAVDVTARNLAEQELREAYQRLELHIEHSPLAFIDVDEGYRVQRWSQRAEELFGYSAEEAMGRTLIEDLGLVHPDDVDPVYEQVRAWIGRGDATTVIRNRNITRDGRELQCEWYNSVIRADDGKVIAIVSVVQDVTAQVEHERELVAAKEEAEEMNRLKTAFLANMSHEVRTPLTAIIGFADVLAEEVDEPHRELVGFIRNGGARLMETLNSVLNLAQLEGRAFHLEPIWFDLVTFTEDRLALFHLQAQQRGIDLRLHAPDDAPLHVQLDASALGRVLANLVSNALKFTAEGSVTVAVAQVGAEVELRVEDTGEGIDVSFLPHVFDEFRQESSGTARRYEGSGLGLAISRRLVELMGGTVTVESIKGQGTTFTVRLPRVMPEGENGEAEEA